MPPILNQFMRDHLYVVLLTQLVNKSEGPELYPSPCFLSQIFDHVAFDSPDNGSFKRHSLESMIDSSWDGKKKREYYDCIVGPMQLFRCWHHPPSSIEWREGNKKANWLNEPTFIPKNRIPHWFIEQKARRVTRKKKKKTKCDRKTFDEVSIALWRWVTTREHVESREVRGEKGRISERVMWW